MNKLLREIPDYFRKETGQSLGLWASIALLNLLAQIVIRREQAAGEFGTFNTVLGLVGLMTVPLTAVDQGIAWYLARPHAPGEAERLSRLRDARLLIVETFSWAWGALAVVLLFLIVELLGLPRFSLSLFALLGALTALGGGVSQALCEKWGRPRLWAGLLIAAALARVIFGGIGTWAAPAAESSLTAFLVAGCILLAPMLTQPATDAAARIKALRVALDADLLLYLGATFSVVLALFLFSSADRIVAQSWFGSPTNNNFNFVDWGAFDAYQTAGLIGRALLWGTLPLLLILFAQRSRLKHSTAASLTWFWIYLGALVLGVALLLLLRRPLSWLFCGAGFEATSDLVPVFALAMLPLGLLQGVGIFSLASRRYHECFVLGGCSVLYTLLLYLFGRRPEIMPAYMFAAGLVSLMAVLFIGIVRWGRKQP